MAVGTVSELVAAARTLLQDTVEPYRYADSLLLQGLNLSLLEARRIRPDMFLTAPSAVSSYSTVDATSVDIDQQYRSAVLYYMVGHVQLTDNEDAQDQRSVSFLNKFLGQLTSVQA